MPGELEVKRRHRLHGLLKVLMLLAAAHLLAGCEVTRIFIIADPDLASLATGETLEITAVVVAAIATVSISVPLATGGKTATGCDLPPPSCPVSGP